MTDKSIYIPNYDKQNSNLLFDLFYDLNQVKKISLNYIFLVLNASQVWLPSGWSMSDQRYQRGGWASLDA